MTAREEAIMDRADRRESAREIAIALRLSESYVSTVIYRNRSADAGGDGGFQKMSRQGTIELARAIAKTGKAWA